MPPALTPSENAFIPCLRERVDAAAGEDRRGRQSVCGRSNGDLRRNPRLDRQRERERENSSSGMRSPPAHSVIHTFLCAAEAMATASRVIFADTEWKGLANSN